jgi:hypothetical protein
MNAVEGMRIVGFQCGSPEHSTVLAINEKTFLLVTVQLCALPGAYQSGDL